MGTLHWPPGHVSDLGHLVEELVAADHHEVGEHQLHHRAQAGQGRANAHAHEPLLRDGGILYTQITILVPQTHGALEVAADDADVLAIWNTVLSRAISSSRASRMASLTINSLMI